MVDHYANDNEVVLKMKCLYQWWNNMQMIMR